MPSIVLKIMAWSFYGKIKLAVVSVNFFWVLCNCSWFSLVNLVLLVEVEILGEITLILKQY